MSIMKKDKTYALRISALTMKFGEKIANDNINLEIKRGEKVALLGANGAGKTTMIESIIGLNKPTSGTISRDFADSKVFQEDLGVQFQGAKYPPCLTVRDIIDFIHDVNDSQITAKELDNLVKAFMIESFIDDEASSLSGGQAQKLNVLLSLVNNPKLLILDEVSTGLDIRARTEIKAYVSKFVQNPAKTLILITHDMSEVVQLCERVVGMRDGKIVIDDSLANIQKKHKNIDKFLEDIVLGNKLQEKY